MPPKRFIISLALLAAAFGLLTLLERGPVVVAARNLDRLPATVAGFRGSERPFDASVMEELDPDVSVSRALTPQPGSNELPMFLYVGYYGTAKGGRTGHNPYACYPGAGWGIVSDKRVAVSFSGREVAVNQIVVHRGEEREVVLFWYQSQRDRIISRGVQHNVNRFLNRLLNGRDDGAFVRLTAGGTGWSEADVARAAAQLRRYAGQLMPVLSAHWPQEAEVGR